MVSIRLFVIFRVKISKEKRRHVVCSIALNRLHKVDHQLLIFAPFPAPQEILDVEL